MYEWIIDTIVTLVMTGFRNGSDPISYSLATVIGTWNLHKRETGGKSIVWYSIIIALSQTTGVWRERKRAISPYNDLLNRSPISIGFFVFTLMTLNTFGKRKLSVLIHRWISKLPKSLLYWIKLFNPTLILLLIYVLLLLVKPVTIRLLQLVA